MCVCVADTIRAAAAAALYILPERMCVYISSAAAAVDDDESRIEASLLHNLLHRLASLYVFIFIPLLHSTRHTRTHWHIIYTKSPI